MMPACPLCRSSILQLVERISTRAVAKIYQRLFGLDVSPYFGDRATIEYYRCSECGLMFYYPVVVGDHSLYDHMQQFDWYYSENKPEFQYAKQFIDADDVVLEVGCGNGRFSKLLDVKKYVGLELSEKAQTAASRQGNSILVQTIEEHAINSTGQYDVVCSFQVLEHVENPETFIRSCISCLKPGGMLILSVPSEDSYLSIIEDGILNMPPHHQTRWSDKTLAWMAGRFNLEIKSLEHERLADDHLYQYATELIRAVLKRMLHLPFNFISTAVHHRAFTLICQVLGRYYTRSLSNPNLRPVGQSVTLVTRKSPSA